MLKKNLDEIFKNYPDLESQVLAVGTSSCRTFYLADGFKDVGQAIVFGDVNWGTPLESTQLLRAVEDVARSRGIRKIVGPLDFSTYFDYRMRLDHFDTQAFPGEPGNSEAAVHSLKSSGFSILKSYFSHEFSLRFNWYFYSLVALTGFKAFLKTGFQFRYLKMSSLNYRNYLPQIYELTKEAFSSNFLYQDIPFTVFENFFVEQVLPNIDSRLSLIVLDKFDKVVAYSLCLKNPNNPSQALFKTIAVRNSYRGTKTLGRLLMCVVYLFSSKEMKTCLACMMIEGTPAEQMFRKMSFSTRTYGLFIKDLS